MRSHTGFGQLGGSCEQPVATVVLAERESERPPGDDRNVPGINGEPSVLDHPGVRRNGEVPRPPLR